MDTDETAASSHHHSNTGKYLVTLVNTSKHFLLTYPLLASFLINPNMADASVGDTIETQIRIYDYGDGIPLIKAIFFVVVEVYTNDYFNYYIE